MAVTQLKSKEGNDTQEPRKKFAGFFGCTLQTKVPWMELAYRKATEALGMQIVDLPFACCPEPIWSRSLSEEAWLAEGILNLNLAEENGESILSFCSGCYQSLSGVAAKLKTNTATVTIVKEAVKEAGQKIPTKVDITHFLKYLVEEVGIERLASLVKRRLNLKVATHTGCHYSRPEAIVNTDNPRAPDHLDLVVEALGCESIDYPDKYLCCGVGLSSIGEGSEELIARKIEALQDTDVDALVIHCPSCTVSYDMGQKMVLKKRKDLKPIPILTLGELVALALGVPPEELAMDQHAIKLKLDEKLKELE